MMEKRKKKSNTNKYFNFGLKIRPSYDYLNELQQIKKLFLNSVKQILTSVLYKLISPSKPLRLCSNLTIGTLAVVIGKMFLRPGEATL